MSNYRSKDLQPRAQSARLTASRFRVQGQGNPVSL